MPLLTSNVMPYKMDSILNNIYTRLMLSIALYFIAFSYALLKFNTILIDYIGQPNGFLYILMLEHFVIALAFGLFWLRMTGIKLLYAVISSLLLPVAFFIVVFIKEQVAPNESEHEGYYLVIFLLAVSQLTGVVFGSFVSHRTSAA